MSSYLDRVGEERELVSKLVEISQELLKRLQTEDGHPVSVEYPFAGNAQTLFLRENRPDQHVIKPKLTLREVQVLGFTANGLSPEQTAVNLGIKVRTVRKYLDLLKRKMGASSRDQLMARAGYLQICNPYRMDPPGKDAL
jgi:DNA-binding CsgD family transcriptional regulator